MKSLVAAALLSSATATATWRKLTTEELQTVTCTSGTRPDGNGGTTHMMVQAEMNLNPGSGVKWEMRPDLRPNVNRVNGDDVPDNNAHNDRNYDAAWYCDVTASCSFDEVEASYHHAVQNSYSGVAGHPDDGSPMTAWGVDAPDHGGYYSFGTDKEILDAGGHGVNQRTNTISFAKNGQSRMNLLHSTNIARFGFSQSYKDEEMFDITDVNVWVNCPAGAPPCTTDDCRFVANDQNDGMDRTGHCATCTILPNGAQKIQWDSNSPLHAAGFHCAKITGGCECTCNNQGSHILQVDGKPVSTDHNVNVPDDDSLTNPTDVGAGVNTFCSSGCDQSCPAGAHGPGWYLPGGTNDEYAELRWDGVELNQPYFTVSMWVNRDDRNSDIGLFSYGEYSHHQGFMVQMRGSDYHIRASSAQSTGFASYDSGNVNWQNSEVVREWLHVAIVKDGDTAIRYYKNGVEVGTANGSFRGSPNTMPADRHFNVGSWFESNKILKGYVSNIHVYSGTESSNAYSDAEVADLYSKESSSTC